MKYTQTELADALTWVEEQNDEFMVPRTYHGSWEEYENDEGESFVVPSGYADPGDLDEGNYGLTDHGTDGWLARLSAPGYMDCTDWIGPYKTEEGVLVELYRVYGD